MSDFMKTMIERAKSDKKTIVLAEGSDVRTLEAARDILSLEFADVIVLGDEDAIVSGPVDVTGATVIDPKTSSLRESLAHELFELRRAKGMTEQDALVLIEDELYFGIMLVKTGRADGMVAGAIHATADVLRPALQIIKTAPDAKLVSSFFVMVVPDCTYGQDGNFIFADCGLNVNPNVDELAEIALSSAASWEALFKTEPAVALISHSTYGSAHNDDAQKVVEAAKIAKEKAPTLKLDGELQVDAALCDEVASLKCAGSSVAGHANVLVFPDLDAGNSGYKLVQRLAHAEAFGPITQGLAAPVNDLSRGCVAEDIVGVCAITCVQAQSKLRS